MFPTVSYFYDCNATFFDLPWGETHNCSNLAEIALTFLWCNPTPCSYPQFVECVSGGGAGNEAVVHVR